MPAKHKILKDYTIHQNKPVRIPGTRMASSRGKTTKEDTVSAAIQKHPRMFRPAPEENGFEKIDIDMTKFLEVLGKHGPKHSGTSEDWCNFWSFMNSLKDLYEESAELEWPERIKVY